MAYDATPAATRVLTAVRGSETLRAAWSVFWTTRAAVLVVAVFAALSFGPAGGGLAERNAEKFDEPELTRSLAEPLLSPLARWDAAWYLRIAESGYGGSDVRAAFFPLYPLLVRAVAAPFGASPGALLVAAYAVSLAAFLGALVLLHRLVSLELGRPLAQPALLLLALFPAAVFFGAPYAESLFLLLAVGAFYAARTGRWAWAGAAAAGAAATRSAGVLLLLPLALIWWSSRPRKARDAAWLVFALAACVGCFRRLPKAYGAWVAASLVLPLTFPVKPQPLMSLPRFLAVLFPIFMWLAVWSEERRATTRVAAVSALGLGLFTAQFASWHWIS